MKSPLYILTALLPLALAIPSPEADVGAESIEERGNPNDKNNNWNNNWNDKDNNQDRCRKNWKIDYRRFPCDGSDKIGDYDRNRHVEYICKYKNYYKTGDNWWVKSNDRPNDCNKGDSPCW